MLNVNLELFLEQGSEGAHWCVYDTTKSGYLGLIMLEEGDALIIPSLNLDLIIKKDYETNKQWFFYTESFIKDNNYRGLLEKNGYDTRELSDSKCLFLAEATYRQQVAGGYYCHWVQETINPDLWAKWFESALPALYHSNF